MPDARSWINIKAFRADVCLHGSSELFLSAAMHSPYALFHGGNKLTCVAIISLLAVKLECAKVEIYRQKLSEDSTAGCLPI